MDYLEKLRDLRTERALSQADIADLLQTTQQYYSKYERGINEIPVRHIVTLCRFYGVSADWLLGLKDGRSFGVGPHPHTGSPDGIRSA